MLYLTPLDDHMVYDTIKPDEMTEKVEENEKTTEELPKML